MAAKTDDKSRSAWDRITSLYDWVRDNIQCRDGQRHGSITTLREGWGQKEDISSLFIALCRALFPAGKRLPAADTDALLSRMDAQLANQTGLQRSLKAGLLWLDTES